MPNYQTIAVVSFVVTQPGRNLSMNIADFIGVAKAISNMSVDPGTKVGALIFGKGLNIVSQGWNGFPRGVKHLSHRYYDKESKYAYTVHAEANAITNAARAGSSTCDCSILVWGLPPCSSCAGLIIQAGIKEVYIPSILNIQQVWKDSFEISKEMFEESGVVVKSI
jgi:dCMP deaminase